jgi:hypothetical protein
MYNYTWRIPLAFTSPCQSPLSFPLNPLLLTWNPPSCDRNRPPRSQVACKLTLLAPPFTQTLPLQIPRTPTAQRLTKATSGIIRLLLSGTVNNEKMGNNLSCSPLEIVNNVFSFLHNSFQQV